MPRNQKKSKKLVEIAKGKDSGSLQEWAGRLVLDDLSECERAKLAMCQMIMRRSRGSLTPIENFFEDVLTGIGFGGIRTPYDIFEGLDQINVEKVKEGPLKTFWRHWEDLHDVAMDLMQNYPEVLRSAQEAINSSPRKKIA